MLKLDGKRIVMERLNPRVGFFYTVKKSLYKGRTKYQTIELVDTEEFGKTLLLDGVTQVVEKNDFEYHELMVHPAMCAHPNPARVLIIGGGDGGILREVLRYRCVREAHLAELDEEVIAFSRKYLTSVCGKSFDDPRVKIRVVDGRSYVEENPGKFDVVIMDMTDPSGPSRMLYTREFFTFVKKCFRTPESIFVMHSESPITRPAATGCIQRTLRAVFEDVTPFVAYIQMYATLWSISVSSAESDLKDLKAKEVDARLKRRGIGGLQLYTGAAHEAMQVAYPYIWSALSGAGRVITDARPDFPDHFNAMV